MPNVFEKILADLTLGMFEKSTKTEKFLLEKYVFMTKNINAEIAKFFAEHSNENGQVNLREARKLLSLEEVKSFKEEIELLKKKFKKTNDRAFINKIEYYKDRIRISRLQRLEILIQQHIVKMSDTKQASITNLLTEGLKKQHEATFKAVAAEIAVDTKFSVMTDYAVKEVLTRPWSGQEYKVRIQGESDRLRTALDTTLVKGFVQGNSYKTIAGEFSKLTGISYNRSKTLVRTEYNYALQQANKKAYSDLNIGKYEYSAIIDQKTTEPCIRLNRQVFKLSEGKPGVNMPPMLPNCRSIILPFFEE